MSPLRALIAGSVRHPILAHLLAISFFVGGYYAATRMTRELFPDITLDHIAVDVRYPGASPEDVEQAICTPIEEAVRGIRGVRESQRKESRFRLGRLRLDAAHGRRAFQHVAESAGRARAL